MQDLSYVYHLLMKGKHNKVGCCYRVKKAKVN